MQDPRTSFVRVPVVVIVKVWSEAGLGGTFRVGEASRCLSDQTQTQQIGIRQPLDRRSLHFEMLECRHEYSCIVLSRGLGAPRRQHAAKNVGFCHSPQ